jgi:hypothetical protein
MVPHRVSNIVIAIVALATVAAASTIPAGTPVTVRLTSAITSETAQAGQPFEASVARDVVAQGKTIVRAGAPVKGKVTHAKSSGRVHAPGQLTLRLTSVDGQPVQSSAVRRQGKSHKKGNVTKIGGGAVAGTAIGAIAGGGKGAAIGALAGGAAGTGVAAATGKQEAVFPAESALTFTITGEAASKR